MSLTNIYMYSFAIYQTFQHPLSLIAKVSGQKVQELFLKVCKGDRTGSSYHQVVTQSHNSAKVFLLHNFHFLISS
jgi:hypothetical protein